MAANDNEWVPVTGTQFLFFIFYFLLFLATKFKEAKWWAATNRYLPRNYLEKSVVLVSHMPNLIDCLIPVWCA